MAEPLGKAVTQSVVLRLPTTVSHKLGYFLAVPTDACILAMAWMPFVSALHWR